MLIGSISHAILKCIDWNNGKKSNYDKELQGMWVSLGACYDDSMGCSWHIFTFSECPENSTSDCVINMQIKCVLDDAMTCIIHN